MLTAVHCAAESVGGMCEASCHLSNSGAQRWERWCSADTSLILFYLCVEILAHGIVLPTFRVCQPSSVKPLWKHLHRNARALSPRWFQIQLTMKINHYNELSQPWQWYCTLNTCQSPSLGNHMQVWCAWKYLNCIVCWIQPCIPIKYVVFKGTTGPFFDSFIATMSKFLPENPPRYFCFLPFKYLAWVFIDCCTFK